MSTRTPPAAEAAPAPVSAPAPLSGAAPGALASTPVPPSAPSRPRSAPPPGVRTAVAAVLMALAGAALLNAPPPTTARTALTATAAGGSLTEPGSLAAPGAPGAPGSAGAPASPRALGAPGAPGAASAGSPATGSGAPARLAPVTFAGKAFDTCEAPSLTVMKAWRGSPYGAVGIYFGGRGRGCPVQKELTPAWVASAHAMGWRLLPLFVGSQAPCVDSLAKRKFAIGSAPATQGTQEGADAVRAARALGIDTSSPLYLDVEAYRRGDTACAATTLAFVRAWNKEVKRLGYVPGFYSSADTGVRDMETQRKAGTKDLPDVMWFARWRGVPALLTESVLHPDAWTPHARIHQYAGNVTETYGGRTLAIDRNAIDAPVARVAAPARFAARVPVPLSFVDSRRP
ncbi:DUF1906 domain-containing protein [Streptomyces sp. NPDC018711]|uniref:DUF1906 domain-containing protein n=1 Tax=Streptomyces sp. NPDC018711 TaxID=3365052 RepID=UPI00378A10D0